MDFFATGGFQQLFNDLDDEQQMDFETEKEVEMNKIEGYEQIKLMPNDHYFVMEANEEDNKRNESKNENDNIFYCHDSDNSIENNRGPFNSFDPVYEIPTMSLERINVDREIDKIVDGEDYRNFKNKNHKHFKMKTKVNTYNPHKKINEIFNENDENLQLESCLNFLLPAENDYSIEMSPLMAAPVHLIDEVAEWECQFLDNYVEIPELIEILPEKTPLCTDTCELFLHETSKILRLAKGHRNESASEMTEINIGDDLMDDFTEGVKEARPKILWNDADTTSGDGSCGGYPCTFGNCDKIYAKPAHLKAHLRRHLGEKPYICTWPECTWKFSRSDELARHRRSHSGVKPYKCDYCGKCFARSDHLAKHRKVHERRLLAASKAGRGCDGPEGVGLPLSIFNVRPGRKRKNQIY